MPYERMASLLSSNSYICLETCESVTNSCAPSAEIGSVDADCDTSGLKGNEDDEEKRVNKAAATSSRINTEIRTFSQGELNRWGKPTKQARDRKHPLPTSIPGPISAAAAASSRVYLK